MKNRPFYRKTQLLIAILLLVLLLWGQTALAAEATQEWRGTYDMAMKWLNFLILAFLIVKLARAPLKGFLEGQKDEVSLEIKSLENQKGAIQTKIEDAQKVLAESEIRLARVKEKIISRAEKEKEEIIEAAQQQSRMILEGAKRRVANRIQQARTTVMTEMLDAAVEAAIKQLPAVITPEDNQKMLDQFMAEMEFA